MMSTPGSFMLSTKSSYPSNNKNGLVPLVLQNNSAINPVSVAIPSSPVTEQKILVDDAVPHPALAIQRPTIKVLSKYKFEKALGNAGYDICADEDITLAPDNVGPVKTDLQMSFPNYLMARILPRSGLALKNHLDTLAGVGDASFRGLYNIIIHNISKDKEFVIKKGDRIAQMVFIYIAHDPEIIRVESAEELSTTERGSKGFGSSGISSIIQ